MLSLAKRVYTDLLIDNWCFTMIGSSDERQIFQKIRERSREVLMLDLIYKDGTGFLVEFYVEQKSENFICLI